MAIPGKRAIIEALEAGIPASSLFISETVRSDRALQKIIDLCREKGIIPKQLSSKDFKRRFDGIERADQGIVLDADPYKYAEMPEILRGADERYGSDGSALIIVCDHITDSGNLGAIIRSADSVGASGVIIPNKRSAHVTSSTYKTSAGAVSHMPVAMVANIRSLLEDLQSKGFWTIACTEHADVLAWDADMQGRIALVLGNEQKGISELALKTCDDACRLPQMGEVSSLNVAQASTVMMYEWLRQNMQDII